MKKIIRALALYTLAAAFAVLAEDITRAASNTLYGGTND